MMRPRVRLRRNPCRTLGTIVAFHREIRIRSAGKHRRQWRQQTIASRCIQRFYDPVAIHQHPPCCFTYRPCRHALRLGRILQELAMRGVAKIERPMPPVSGSEVRSRHNGLRLKHRRARPGRSLRCDSGCHRQLERHGYHGHQFSASQPRDFQRSLIVSANASWHAEYEVHRCAIQPRGPALAGDP